MSDQPTYEELELRCQRLANIIVRNNHATEELIRSEVKKAKAQAWDECEKAWEQAHKISHREPWDYMKDNPYKEGQK